MKRSFSLNSAITLEGHLKLKVILDETNRVVDVESSNVSFKDTDLLLKNRDKKEVPRLAMRLFGVGASNHYQRSLEAVENAMGLELSSQGECVRDLINGLYYIYDHISHFYHLHGLDWIDLKKVIESPLDSEFKRKIENQIQQGNFTLERKIADIDLSPQENIEFLRSYFEALKIQGEIMKVLSLLGCKMLFPNNFVLGGVVTPYILEDEKKANEIIDSIEKVKLFINKNYNKDLLLILKNYKISQSDLGVGVKNFLSVGDLLSKKGKEILPSGAVIDGEYIDLSKEDLAEHIFGGFAKKEKRDIKSFFKKEFEVGPLARCKVALEKKQSLLGEALYGFFEKNSLKKSLLESFLGRHIARFIESKTIVNEAIYKIEFLLEVFQKKQSNFSNPLPASQSQIHSFGYSLSESSRGTIGHFLSLQGGKVENYTSVVPTNLNVGNQQSRGVYEKSLIGLKVKDPKNPYEILQIIHSFNQCVCCTLLLTDEKGKGFGIHKIDTSCTI